MKEAYTAEDILRGLAWYAKHKDHVDRLIKGARHSFPMSGSDIGHPELWKAGGWKWFLERWTLPNIEVFYHNGVDKLDPEAETYVAGWYWWPCFPGCLPDGEPVGPFVTEAEAITGGN